MVCAVSAAQLAWIPPVSPIYERIAVMQTRSTSTIGRLLVAAAVLLGFVTAASLLPSAATAADVRSTVPVANRVELLRTGGITGVPVTFTVDAMNTAEDSARLLALVSTPEFLALAPVYGPKNPCCDFFLYTLTVTYNGGGTKRVFTSDAAEVAPAILLTVIRLTERVGSTGNVS
jgi:hypothetical protein